MSTARSDSLHGLSLGGMMAFALASSTAEDNLMLDAHRD